MCVTVACVDIGRGSTGLSWIAAASSSGCLGYWVRSAMSRFVRSQAVSVNSQKNGGLSVHPMGRTNGKATKGSVPVSGGSTTPSFATPDVATGTR